MLNKIKSLFKKEEVNNPFTEVQSLDRRIEKFMYCRVCKNPFGKNYENVVIAYKDNITSIGCKECGEVYNFRNFNIVDNKKEGDNIV